LTFLCSATAQATDARAALQNAASLFAQGNLEEADQQARIALSNPQTRPVAFSILGSIRLQQNRLAESATLLKEAIQLEPHLLGAHLTLAQVYTLEGKPGLALPLYRRVLTLDSYNVTARFALAQFEKEKGNYQQSLEMAKWVLPDLKQAADGLLLLATDYLKTEDLASAAGLASDWKRLPNVPVELSIHFALLLAKGGVVSEAIDVLEGVRQQSSGSYELAFNLAGLYTLQKDFKSALDFYDKALMLKPDSVPALQEAARLAEDRGELERSLSYWMRAKKIEPNNPELLFGFGRVCLKMDLLDDAEHALTQVVSLRPDNPSYLYMLASTKVGKKQFDAAQIILEGLVKQKPSDPQLHYALGSVLYLQSHLEDAAAHLHESVRLQPLQLAPYYYLALVARDQGRDAEAIQALESLLQRFPDHAPSCEALGSLLMSAHRYPEAEANLEKAIQLNPKSVKSNYQLGLLLTRMGRKEEADRQLEVAKALRKDDSENSRLQLRLIDPDQ
jgi:tetratricopeptide (TPR) repeat protein